MAKVELEVTSEPVDEFKLAKHYVAGTVLATRWGTYHLKGRDTNDVVGLTNGETEQCLIAPFRALRPGEVVKLSNE